MKSGYLGELFDLYRACILRNSHTKSNRASISNTASSQIAISWGRLKLCRAHKQPEVCRLEEHFSGEDQKPGNLPCLCRLEKRECEREQHPWLQRAGHLSTFGAAGREGQAWGGLALCPLSRCCCGYPTKQKLKEIAFFWRKSNYMETSAACLSGANRCSLGFEAATLCLLYLL